MNEVGSEFWLDDNDCPTIKNPTWENWHRNMRSYLSGRTALSAILDDISLATSHRHYATAYLPSYCCHTMIEPFLRHGMKVEFYTVAFKDGAFIQQIDATMHCDVVLVLDYFGYSQECQALPQGAIIVRDMTHSLFTQNVSCDDANYLFASFRKWGPVAGAAMAVKRFGSWLITETTRQHPSYIALRESGFRDKAKYMANETCAGKGYLEKFHQAETLLEFDYENYAADIESLGIASCLGTSVIPRRRNAQQLLNALRHFSTVEPLFATLGDNDAPLFVPVVVKNGKRDALSRFLISNRVYCPVHWPISELHKITSEERALYDAEISLICDQRYDETNMNYQLDMIKRFESKDA